MEKPHIVILGAGPAGLGAAFRLTSRNLARVTIIEKNGRVGGIAGSFEIAGVHVDYGSHRLHPSCDPEIIRDIKTLLGDDLLDRPRHGRIRMCGRWIHFPLKPLDLIVHLPPAFSAGILKDMITKTLKRQNGSVPDGRESFSSIMESGLGRTICQNFYFPYTEKLWGLPPEGLSAVQARRRVSANSLRKMFNKAVSSMPFVKKNGAGRFFYPKNGFGQISEAFYKAAVDAGAEFFLNAPLKKISVTGQSVKSVCFECNGQMLEREADFIWSTIPVSDLVECIELSPPDEVSGSLRQIEYRSMILIYLLLEQDRFSEYDAHYFPELDIPISRISETKNYYNAQEPAGYTVLCAELPCGGDAPEWDMTDDDLGKIVCKCLESAGIPVSVPVNKVMTRRLSHAYPVYRMGYEKHFGRVDGWLGGFENLISFGRQGLFVHDNIHLAMNMAYSAVECISEKGDFDDSKWKGYREIFEKQVVED
jgi:protoporphyrinogen oxidase